MGNAADAARGSVENVKGHVMPHIDSTANGLSDLAILNLIAHLRPFSDGNSSGAVNDPDAWVRMFS